jgi:hypothetical protein
MHKAIRTALRVDLDKPAADQPYLHVSFPEDSNAFTNRLIVRL